MKKLLSLGLGPKDSKNREFGKVKIARYAKSASFDAREKTFQERFLSFYSIVNTIHKK